MDGIGGPLTDGAIWRGALFWALALYIPLSGPLGKLETSLGDMALSQNITQALLILSSVLLALAVGMVMELLVSWTLGPGWGSSLALIGIGWSLLLVVTESGRS